MNTNFVIALLVARLVFSATTASASSGIPEASVTAAEWAVLPRYCPYTMAYRGWGHPDRSKWENMMGKSFYHMHHYCWARMNIHRAERSNMPPQEKHASRLAALDDLDYVLRNADADFILRPEILTWVGRTTLLDKGSEDKAGEAFAKARKIKPDYWPAYLHWAEFLRSKGRKADALALVKTGLQHAPEAKSLQALFRDLGGRPEEIPLPITSHPVQEDLSPPQAQSQPAPATEPEGQH